MKKGYLFLAILLGGIILSTVVSVNIVSAKKAEYAQLQKNVKHIQSELLTLDNLNSSLEEYTLELEDRIRQAKKTLNNS